MGSERMESSAKERERLKVVQQVEEGHLKQIEAAQAQLLLPLLIPLMERAIPCTSCCPMVAQRQASS